MSKQRTQRQNIEEPVRAIPSVEAAQPTERDDAHVETLRDEIAHLQEEIGVLQAALQRAEEYIKALEEEKMLKTSNMPGGSEEPLIWMPSSRRVDETPVAKVYRGEDLGPCNRDVVNTKQSQNHKLNVTFATNAVYEIEFVNGRAKVPQKIADYVHAENPGNCMRTV